MSAICRFTAKKLHCPYGATCKWRDSHAGGYGLSSDVKSESQALRSLVKKEVAMEKAQEGKGKKNEGKGGEAIDPAKVLVLMKPHMAAVNNLLQRKKALVEKKVTVSMSAPSAGWFGDAKDVKVPVTVNADALAIERDLQLVESELKLLRTTARAALFNGFGTKLLKMKLWIAETWATSGSNITGIVAADPSVVTEFASLAALFDEYRCVGGEAHIYVTCASDPATSTNDPRVIYAYDPAESVNLTTLVAGLQLQQHKLMYAYNGTSSATPAQIPNTYSFNWKVPAGVITTSGSAPVASSGNWQPTDRKSVV